MKTGDCDLAWYVLTVSPLCEMAVARRLKRLFGGVLEADGGVEAPEGVATYVPIAEREVRRQHKRIKVGRTVMPRYLFFGYAGVVPWLDVLGVLGVRGVLSVDGLPETIPAEVVGSLILRLERGEGMDGRPPVHVGMDVVAKFGRHKGLEGEVEAIDRSRGVAEVVFEMLSDLVEMNIDDIAPVAYASRRMIG